MNEKSPYFIYINSEWLSETKSNEYFNDEITYYEFSNKEDFVCLVNTWFSFISGCIINREKLLERNKAFIARQFKGMFLPQLAWTLNMVKYGDKFIYSKFCCINHYGNLIDGHYTFSDETVEINDDEIKEDDNIYKNNYNK